MATAMAVRRGNNKIIKLYIKVFLTDLADVTNDLSMPCHEQRTGAVTEHIM